MDGPILKDAAYFGFWLFVLACGLAVGGRVIWLLSDIRGLLIDLLRVLARG